MAERLRVAAIITIYHPKSHADVIVTKFLKGASIDDGRYAFDNVEIVSIYLDHALENDIGLGLAEQFETHLAKSRPQRLARTTAWDRWWILVAALGFWAVAWGLRRSSGLV